MKRLLSFVCILGLGVSAFAAEQVLNGGLESWTGGVPDSWDLTNISTAGAVTAPSMYTITQETSVVHGGTSSMKAVATGATWTARVFASTNSFQLAGWAPDTVSCWLNFAANGTVTSPGTYLRATRGYHNGTTWVVDTNATGQLTYSGTGWKNLTSTAWDLHSYPTRVSFHNIQNVIVYVDDVSVDGTVPVEVSAFALD
ncbi:MAG TPA: hypothetical protein VHP11_14610 [Tepidisphaeraceae bacterium]|nr:hypothetical protein [Tepidisphaeraceae bacterium]